MQRVENSEIVGTRISVLFHLPLSPRVQSSFGPAPSAIFRANIAEILSLRAAFATNYSLNSSRLDLDESSLVFVAQFHFERSVLGCISEKSISPRRITDRSHLVVLDLNK